MALRSGWVGTRGGGVGSGREHEKERAWEMDIARKMSKVRFFKKISFKKGKKKLLKNNSLMSNCFLGFKFRMKFLSRVMPSGVFTWTLNWYAWEWVIYRNRDRHRQNLERFSKGHRFLWIYFHVCYDADFCFSYFYLILSFCL